MLAELKPAWDLKTKDSWARSGSNNVRPDPDTIRKGLRETSMFNTQARWSERTLKNEKIHAVFMVGEKLS